MGRLTALTALAIVLVTAYITVRKHVIYLLLAFKLVLELFASSASLLFNRY